MRLPSSALALWIALLVPSCTGPPPPPPVEPPPVVELPRPPSAHFVRRSLTKWGLRDVDRDGEEDLVVDVQVGDGVVTKAVLAACSAEDESAPRKGTLPPMRAMQLTWTATPTGFKPNAATAGHLKQLEAARKKTEQ